MDTQNQTNSVSTSESSQSLVKPIVPKQTPLLLILVVLVVILLGSTGYLAYQNMQLQKRLAISTQTSASPMTSSASDLTANWKTSNLPSFLNFSFKYPTDWNMIYDTQVTLRNGSYSWLIAISDNSQLVSLRDYVTSAPVANLHAGSRRLTPPQFDSAEKTTIDGIPAIKLDNNGSEEVFFVQGNQEFYIRYPLKDYTNPESVANYKTVQEVISTFQFTNPTFSVDTSNWKTYANTNSQFGYSLKYPNNLVLDEETQRPGFISIHSSQTPSSPEVLALFPYTTLFRSQNLSANNYVRTVFNSDLLKQLTLTPVSIAGLNSIEILNAPGMPGYHIETFIPYKGKVFSLGLDTSSSSSDWINIFSQILSTIQFAQ